MRTVAKVDTDSSAVQLVIIHVSNRTKGSLWILKLDESKTAWFSSFHICDQSNLDNSANFGEGLMELFLRRVKRKISNENIMLLLLLRLT
jgi:hypothetical protein